MSRKRAKKIKLLLFDVDGVLTDGKLFIFPAPPGIQQSIRQHSSKHGGNAVLDCTANPISRPKDSMRMMELRYLWRGLRESRPDSLQRESPRPLLFGPGI